MLKEGIVPIIAGSIVVSAGAVMKSMEMKQRNMRKDELMPMATAGIIGFGLAHLVLGSIDLAQNRHHKHSFFS